MMLALENVKCCGCGACANICLRSCITMESDFEGFLYPKINKEQCVNCGLCEKVCPEASYMEIPQNRKALAIQCVDTKSRARSTAGGGFVPIAEYVLENDGVVFGAAYNANFDVKHIIIDSLQELKWLQGSKYVQSVIGDTYGQAYESLCKGKWVLFSGTPCQIAGLKKFLLFRGKSRQYDKLITVSVACRAVPSPLIFKKYIELQQERFDGTIESVNCRDKYYGYSYSTMSVYSLNKNKHKDYHYSVESDEWLRCFFSGVCDRPCCASCNYKGPVGDFHIGDYFRVGESAPELDDNRGTTRMVITSDQGEKIFAQLKGKYKYKEVSDEQIRKTTQNALSDFGKDKGKRNIFFEDANKLTGSELFHKYYPRTLKVRILQYGRIITYRLGIYNFLKNVLMKIKHKSNWGTK